MIDQSEMVALAHKELNLAFRRFDSDGSGLLEKS